MGVSNGTCVFGTVPPGGPGTEVSRSGAGRDAPTNQWRWLALEGPESAYGPGSLLELGRSGPETNRYIFIFSSYATLCLNKDDVVGVSKYLVPG